jgi:phosphoglycolate phosphatase
MRLVLWSLDGVLIPDGPFNDEVLRQVCGELLGAPCEELAATSGRTALRVVRDTLRLNGVPDGALDARMAGAGELLTGAIQERRAELIARDRVPGATETLLALRMRGDVCQSLVSGDVERAARAKANAFEFDRYLDAIDVGGFGSDSEDFDDLIGVALEKFRVAHGQAPSTVAVVRLPAEVASAVKAGVGVVAVAADPDEAARLRDAGAGHVLAGLTDNVAVVAAIDGL